MAPSQSTTFTALTSNIQVDPAGDLRVLVQHGEQQISFQVSSKAMSLASPVWRTMLDPDGPFKESRPDKGEVAFHDDNAEALLILLLAAHLRFQDVPQELWFEQLRSVCIACDKYDCIGLVRPWISRWQAREIHLAGLEVYDQWLFVAWTTGDEETFERVARRFVEISESNGSKHCYVNWTVLVDMPPGIVDGIREARLQTLTKLVTLCQSVVDHWGPTGLSLHDVSACTDDFALKHAKGCNDLVTNSLMTQFKADEMGWDMWPGDPKKIASRWPKGVGKLAWLMRSMTCHTYPSRYYHKECGFAAALHDGVDRILTEMPSGMNESHRRHMATQRSKLSQSHNLLGQLGRPRQPPPPEEKR